MTQNFDSICLYFVLKNDYLNEEDASLDMQRAFQNAANWSVKTRWIKESDCLPVENQMKCQVFVFEEFEGEIFFNFVESHKKSRVIGPKCLLRCFSKQIPIPNTKYPVFNMAMNNLMICVSNMPIEDKKKMEKLVGYMGGKFTHDLLTSTSHLVVNSVLSEKYFRACEEGIQVMTQRWVEDIWKKNLIEDIEATDDNIIKEYKCPIFYNLKVTASTLSESEKNDIKKIVFENGGIYTSEMTMKTNILITPVGRGQKFKYAERWKIKCVNPSWIKCCINKGYAVRYDDYIVCSEEKKCSTPVDTCRKMVSLMDTNDTDISVIPSCSAKSIVSESVAADTQLPNQSIARNNVFKTPVKSVEGNENVQKILNNTKYQNILNNIVLSDVKKCGPLLDGCKIYLAGFNANEEEKLRRILNYGNAMRFMELNDSVTHVIVGNPNKNDLQDLKTLSHKPHIVTLDWLSTSIRKGCLEKESNCLYFSENREDMPSISKALQQPSPLSKKGLQILNPIRNMSGNPQPTIDVDQNLIEKYSHVPCPGPVEIETETNKESNTKGDDINCIQTAISTVNEKLFGGLNFAIVGHTPSATEDIKRTILDFGGSINTGNSATDYTIVPVINVLKMTGITEIVTSIWIEDCLYENKIIPTKYYHRPLTIPEFLDGSSLRNCVITFSSYGICERQYLEKVASILGATCQDVLSKKQNSEKNVARTTHLVCALAQGIKYNAAKKWNLPIITEKWLLNSFSQRKILPMDSFLLYDYKDNQSIAASSMSTKTVVPADNVPYTSNSSKKDTANSRTALTNVHVNMRSESSIEGDPDSNKIDVPIRKTNLPSKNINARRLTYTMPTLAEAVSGSSDKSHTDRNNKLKAASEIRDLPTGILAKINLEASTSGKRKLDGESSYLEAARIGSPRKKLIRSDPANMSTSSYEEVGWQDTLTDDNHIPGNFSSSNDEATDVNKLNNENARVLQSIDDTKKKLTNRIPPSESSKSHLENKKTQNENTARRSQISCVERIHQSHTNTTANRTYRNMMISVANNEKRQQCEAIIISLGGCVSSRYDPDCLETEQVTHLIIDELKKTEKLLCSIASGLWVLHSSYLNQCQESGKFIDEEEFEWGNPLNKNLPVKESKDYSSIAKAAYRWRKLIQNEGPSKRPFVGMKAVIVSSSTDESVQSLMRVVKSGGGTLVPPNEILKATHCLVKSAKNLDNLPTPMKHLAAKKIHCVPAVYLSDYLMYDPPPKPEMCYFDVYKRFF